MARSIDPIIIDAVKKFVTQVNKKYPIKQTLIFGSQAKGTPKNWSDIDVCLVSDKFPKDLYELRLELNRISQQYDDRIETHPILTEDFNNRYYTFAREVKKYGIIV